MCYCKLSGCSFQRWNSSPQPFASSVVVSQSSTTTNNNNATNSTTTTIVVTIITTPNNININNNSAPAKRESPWLGERPRAAAFPYHTVGFHNFNLRIFNLRVSNPNKFIVDVFLTRCRTSMCQGLGPKKHDEISEIDRTLYEELTRLARD